jgi:hypothetical protein
MKYFQIKQETEYKIIGKYPQFKDLKIGFHEARGEQWAEVDKWKDESDLPDLDQFLLHPKSKLTDNMSSNFIITCSGLIISKKFYEILQRFRINGQFKSATIHICKAKHENYLLWYEYGAESKINWKDSKFIEYYDGNAETRKYGDQITITDFEDYCKKARALRERNSLWKIVPIEFRLAGNFDLTPMYFTGLMCNEKL